MGLAGILRRRCKADGAGHRTTCDGGSTMKLVFPDSPTLREVFAADISPGASLHPWQSKKKKASTPEERVRGERTRARRRYLDRLERAEQRGQLPKRIYISPRLWGFEEEALAKAIAALQVSEEQRTPEEPPQLRQAQGRAGRRRSRKK